jgi:hypothetical protein
MEKQLLPNQSASLLQKRESDSGRWNYSWDRHSRNRDT